MAYEAEERDVERVKSHGEEHGWTGGGLIDLEESAQLFDDGLLVCGADVDEAGTSKQQHHSLLFPKRRSEGPLHPVQLQQRIHAAVEYDTIQVELVVAEEGIVLIAAITFYGLTSVRLERTGNSFKILDHLLPYLL
jgi:hypothetical protein